MSAADARLPSIFRAARAAATAKRLDAASRSFRLAPRVAGATRMARTRGYGARLGDG